MHAAVGSSTLSLPVTARVPPPITVRVLAAVKNLPRHCQAPLPSLSGTCLVTVRHLCCRCQAPGCQAPCCQAPPSSLSGTSVVVIRHLCCRYQAPPSSLSGTSLLAVRHLPPHCQAPPSLLLGTSLVAIRYLPHHRQIPPSSPLSTPSSPSLSSLVAPHRCCQHCCHSWFVVVSGSSSLSSVLLSFLVSLL